MTIQSLDIIAECVIRLEEDNPHLANAIHQLGALVAYYETECAALRHELIWCSGAPEFQEGAEAHEGWKKGPAEVLKGNAGKSLLQELLQLRAEKSSADVNDVPGLPTRQR